MAVEVENPAIPQGYIVLITGVNGLVGSHVADQFLAAGYKVRGAVRDIKKNSWLSDLFNSKYGKGNFELVAVKDMTADGAFDEAVKDVSGVVHLASITTFAPDPDSVIPPTIAGAVSVLKSAGKEPSVKRFVYTSSSAATTLPKPNKEFTIGQDSWNEEAIKAAWEPPHESYTVYAASKARAEQEVWKWAKENGEGMVVNAVLPNANFGKPLSVENQGHPSTVGLVAALFKGDTSVAGMMTPQYFVNVQDTARLHVAALLRPDVANERIFAFAAPFNVNDILAVFRKTYPDKTFPDDIPDLGRDLSKVPRGRAEQLLKDTGRPGWTGFEESIKANVEDLVMA